MSPSKAETLVAPLIESVWTATTLPATAESETTWPASVGVVQSAGGWPSTSRSAMRLCPSLPSMR